jgi:hypothetical protein
MARADEILKGLQILIKYNPKGWCDAQHDVLYGPEVENISDEDKQALLQLRWLYDASVDSWYVFT